MDITISERNILEFLMKSGVTTFVGEIVYLICVLALSAKWIRQPEWRSTETFNGLGEVIFATIAYTLSCFLTIPKIFGVSIPFYWIMNCVNVSRNVLEYSVCWSFCTPIAVYKELKGIHKPITHGKIFAVMLTVALFALSILVEIGLKHFAHFKCDNLEIAIGITIFSILEHLFVVFNLGCSERIMKRNQDKIHLVKIGLLTQVITLASLLLTVLTIFYFLSYSVSLWLYVFGQILIIIRLVPLSVALFHHKTTGDKLAKDDVENPKQVKE